MQLSWLAKYQTYTPDLEPLMQSRVENYRITASDLTGFIDLDSDKEQAQLFILRASAMTNH